MDNKKIYLKNRKVLKVSGNNCVEFLNNILTSDITKLKSKEVLQDAINKFEGTVILVSHDRSFLDGVVNKVLEVSKGSMRMLTCNVSEYIQRIESEMEQ